MTEGSLRKGDQDKEFRKQLQNPPKPINPTEPSPEMEEHLRKLNSGELFEEEKKKREEEEEKKVEEARKYTLFCPKCRRPTLKKGPQGYSCGYCGLDTLAPLRMAIEEKPEEKEKEKTEKKK